MNKFDVKLELGADGFINKKIEKKEDIEIPLYLRRTSFKPAGDRILADPIPVKDEVQAGIIIPKEVQMDRMPKAIIVAVGPDITEYKPGDLVMFNGMHASGVRVDNHLYVLLSRHEILGTYTDIQYKYEEENVPSVGDMMDRLNEPNKEFKSNNES